MYGAKLKNKLIISLFSLFVLTSNVQANVTDDLGKLSLEDLMDVDVKVATETAKPLREAAGVISVITDKEIKSMGARDLKDILQSVPGITFGYDVQGVVSIIMRGIWAQEGRILVLMDGIEMNERAYGTLLLTNHLPAELIKRVEIIRGPGSAIYGGFGELGVINITTKDSADLKGANFSSSYARTSKDFSQSNTNFMFGHEKDGLNASIKGLINNSNFSDRNYTDETGNSTTLANGNSQAGGKFFNLRIAYKPVYFNYIKDDFKTNTIMLFGDNSETGGKPIPINHLSDAYQVGYKDYITNDLNLHLYYQNKIQLPYNQPDPRRDGQYTFRRKIESNVYGLKTQYQFSAKTNLNTGAEFSEDKGTSEDAVGFAGAHTFGLNNTAVFTQLDHASSIANFTAGIRYVKPNKFDTSIVPRLGITKVMGKNHFKALYAKSFRAPVIQNVAANEAIKPETATTGEVEFGHKFSNKFSWNLNLYSTKIENPIIYSTDGTTEFYNNYNHVKVMGAETEINLIHKIQEIKLSYSSYKLVSLNADRYKTGKDSSALIGSPRHKLYIRDILTVSEDFEVTPSLTVLMGTNSYSRSENDFSEARKNNQIIANIFSNYKNVFISGFEIGAGINNILNDNIFYAQPYALPGDTLAGAYPGQSREYVLRLGYSKEF